jgi:hypothetical protein
MRQSCDIGLTQGVQRTSGAHGASATSPLSSVDTMVHVASPDDAGTTSLGGPTARNARPSTWRVRQENKAVLPWAMATRASKRPETISGTAATTNAGGAPGARAVNSMGGWLLTVANDPGVARAAAAGTLATEHVRGGAAELGVDDHGSDCDSAILIAERMRKESNDNQY